MMMIEQDDLAMLAEAHAAATKPGDIFDAVKDVVGKRIGYSLLTMLMLTADGDEVQRIYTTDTVNYPVSGRERLGTTPWGQKVLVRQEAFLATDPAGVKWAFPADFDLIASLGLGAAINVPILSIGKTLGSMNILHQDGRLGPEQLRLARMLAPFLAVPFLASMDAGRER